MFRLQHAEGDSMIDRTEFYRRQRLGLCLRCGVEEAPEASGYRPREYCTEAHRRQAAKARARFKAKHPDAGLDEIDLSGCN